MKRFIFTLLLLLSLIITYPVTVGAHPGRTDQYGGHWNHSTGEYHYHGTPDSSHSGGSNSGSTTNRDWGNSGTSSGGSGSSSGLDGDEIFDIIVICVILGPFVLFVLWMLVISPIIDKINEFFHPLPKEPPTTETPPQPHEDTPVPPSAEQKQPTPTPPSRPKIQGSESVHSKTPASTPASPPPQTEVPSAQPKTRPTPTTHFRGSENTYTPATQKKQPVISKPNGYPQKQSVIQKPNGYPKNQSISQITERFPKGTTKQQASQVQATTAATVPTQSAPNTPGWLLDINSDYFTAAQKVQFASALDISRAKRAITEQFPFKDLHIDENSTPRRVTCSVISLNSPQKYNTTLTSCTCKDYKTRHFPCKHMIALAIMVNAIIVDQEQIKGHRK